MYFSQNNYRHKSYFNFIFIFLVTLLKNYFLKTIDENSKTNKFFGFYKKKKIENTSKQPLTIEVQTTCTNSTKEKLK